MPTKLTLKHVRAELAKRGVTIRRNNYAEFVVRLKGSPLGQGYFADALDDALSTGLYMADRRDGVIEPQAKPGPTLIFSETAVPVKVGAGVTVSGQAMAVVFFREPHKPASSGKVYLKDGQGREHCFYVSVIGAEWINRTDR
jgi:hypothetical protein